MSNIKKRNNDVEKTYLKNKSKVRGANAAVGLEGVVLSAMNFMDALNRSSLEGVHTKRTLTKEEEKELTPIEGNVVVSYTKEDIEKNSNKNKQIEENKNNIFEQ